MRTSTTKAPGAWRRGVFEHRGGGSGGGPEERNAVGRSKTNWSDGKKEQRLFSVNPSTGAGKKEQRLFKADPSQVK